MNSESNDHAFKVLRRSIKRLNLNLSGLKVFTEAASNNYAFTPIIAALAGADMTYAIAANSKYGSKESIMDRTMELGQLAGCDDRIQVIFKKDRDAISTCDIVTNSGFVRPIDKNFLKIMKPTAVIPLMFEAWEARDKDLDLSACREYGIPVLGTNENHPDLRLFYSSGFLASKLLFEQGMEVYRNRILVIGSGKIASSIQSFLRKNNIEFERITVDEAEHRPGAGVHHVSSSKDIIDSDYDAVVIAELQSQIRIIGEDGLINRANAHRFRGVPMAYLCGSIDSDFIDSQSLRVNPPEPAASGFMARSGDYLGPAITLDLVTAGMKVGEIMARLRKSGKTYEETIDAASKDPLVSGFEKKDDGPEVSNPELLSDLKNLHEELRTHTLQKFGRANPFCEDLFDWKEKGRALGWHNVTIYDSATVVGDVTVGEGTWIGPFCSIDGSGGLTIGKNCSISAGTQIMSHDTVLRALSGGAKDSEHAHVSIGDNCFIGVHAIILKGVTIGNRCVVAANSLVNRSFPDNTIIAGTPACRIGIVEANGADIRLNYDQTD